MLVIDESDASEADAVAGHGFQVAQAPIVIPDETRRAALARTILGLTSDWPQ